jgi:hypothetical protein
MNLNKIKPLETATLEIINPIDNSQTGAKITVHGRFTRQFRNAKIDLARSIVIERIEDNDYMDELKQTLLAGLIVSWENVEDDDGTVEFTTENAVKLVKENFVIEEQIEKFVETDTNFFTIGSTT